MRYAHRHRIEYADLWWGLFCDVSAVNTYAKHHGLMALVYFDAHIDTLDDDGRRDRRTRLPGIDGTEKGLVGGLAAVCGSITGLMSV